ncbi:hypothetical protein DFA_05155 [Cavenderia fasciculata]|uniref:Nbr1 FW domain-containing protein n=1 Tax=Cavenderia fasciculata TaxID=261658 RepID=F4PNH2_CACFS|nr:uncharacterized protein DFA_05155 [Cavenderia fasciculata]EGG23025.1 hypothetical protein DFA_05155 [Cavenderia fasciculata]|eukprot:XP_004360876.1 hypothetical protein DFA_05155 [Cavenderia fasciculata]
MGDNPYACKIRQFFQGNTANGNVNHQMTTMSSSNISNSTTTNEQQQQILPETTTLQINMGTECKTLNVPKSTCYKELSNCIKETFGLNSKSVLNIKCENQEGDMFNVASDCHLKKAYRKNQEELRLVVKEITPHQACKNSLFSFFGFNCPDTNNNNNNNHNNNTIPTIHNNNNNNNTNITTTTTANTPSTSTSNINNNNNSTPISIAPTTTPSHIGGGGGGASLLTGALLGYNNHHHTNNHHHSTAVEVGSSFVSMQSNLAAPTIVQDAPNFFKSNSNDQSSVMLDSHLQPLHNNNHHNNNHNNHNNSHHIQHNNHGHLNHFHHHNSGGYHLGVHHNSLTHVSPMFRGSSISHTPLLQQQKSMSGLSSTFSSLSLQQQQQNQNQQPTTKSQPQQTIATSPSMSIPTNIPTPQKRNSPNNLMSSPISSGVKLKELLKQNQHNNHLGGYGSLVSPSQPTQPTLSSTVISSQTVVAPNTTATTTPVSPTIQSIKDQDKTQINRNQSFEFLADEDNESTSSVSSYSPSLDKSTDSVKSVVDVVASSEPAIPKLPNAMCPLMQKLTSSADANPAQSKEVMEFIMQIKKNFEGLRLTNDFREKREIKGRICEMIQTARVTMPWILNIFPQLSQFASDTCQVSDVPVPPNTPPPSPTAQSPLVDRAKIAEQQACIYRVSAEVPLAQLHSHLQLQSKLESMVCGGEKYQQQINTFKQHQSEMQDNNNNHHNNNNNSNGVTTHKMQMDSSKCMMKNLKFEGPTVHRGTTCTVCTQSPIIGTFYYCSVCTGFTFCDSCRAQQSIHECPKANQSTIDQSNNIHHPLHRIIAVTKAMKSCNLTSSQQQQQLPQQQTQLQQQHSTSSSSSLSLVNNSPKRGCPYNRKKFKCTFNVKFVADVTLPFGLATEPGQQLIKTWRLHNVGSQLPKDCLLVRVCGNTKLAQKISVPVPAAPAGQTFTVSVPIAIPIIPSSYSELIVGEYWRLCTGDGFYFGDQFWISLVIKNTQHNNNNNNSNNNTKNTENFNDKEMSDVSMVCDGQS